MREKKLKIIQAFDNGEITESEARELIGRLQAKGGPVFRKEREVIDEAHPDISVSTRMAYKNLSTDPTAGLSKMQQEYPEHNFKFDASGDVLIRRKDEDAWRKLDPSATSVGELAKDIGDIAFDVPAAIFETGATVAGGTLGAVAGAPTVVGAPIGAAVGAGTAGAAAGATTESVRQGLGKLTGYTEEFDPAMIGVSAAFGAASPLMFGSGATAKSVLKNMTKKGMVAEMGEEAATKYAEKIVNAQRSVLGRGIGKVINATTPKLASWASGYTPEALTALRERMGSGLMTVNPAEIPKAFRADITGAFAKKKEMLGKVYGEALESLDVAIDTRKAEQPFFDLLKTYKTRAEKAVPGFEKLLADGKKINNVDVQDFMYLQQAIDPYLQKGRVLEGSEVVNYLDKMKDLSKLRKNTNVQGMSKVDQDLIRVTKQIGGAVDEGLESTLVGQEFKNLKDQYGQLFKDEEVIKKYLRDDKAAESSLRNLQSQADFTRKEQLETLAENYGVKLKDYADDMYLMSQFLSPSSSGKYLGGTSPMNRAIPLSLAGGAVGYGVGQQADTSPYLTSMALGTLGAMSGSPQMIKRYTQMGNMARQGINQIAPAVPRAAGIYQQINQRDK